MRIGPLCDSDIFVEISAVLLILILSMYLNDGGSQGKNRLSFGLKLATLMA